MSVTIAQVRLLPDLRLHRLEELEFAYEIQVRSEDGTEWEPLESYEPYIEYLDVSDAWNDLVRKRMASHTRKRFLADPQRQRGD